MNPVQKVIDHVGGVTALAEKVGTSPNNIINWRSRGVPAEWCAPLEQAGEGCVSRCELYGDGAVQIWPELCKVATRKKAA